MDQITDRNRAGLFKIARTVELPDFVKEAQLPESDDVVELRSDAFGDPPHRRYPIDTPENAWLSCAYFEKFAEDCYGHSPKAQKQMAEIRGRLKEAAEFWKIEYPELPDEPLEELPVIKYAMDDTVYLEVPVENEEKLRYIAQDIQKQAGRYPYAMRRGVARQLLALAAPDTFDPEFSVELEKTAGYGVASIENATELLNGRKHLLCNKEAEETVSSLIEEIQSSGQAGLLSPGMTNKIARLADSIDRLAGQHVRYTPETLPEKKLVTLTASQMEDFNKSAVHLANGAVLTPDEARDLSQFVQQYTGQKVADDRLKETLESLDRHTCDVALQAFAR